MKVVSLPAYCISPLRRRSRRLVENNFDLHWSFNGLKLNRLAVIAAKKVVPLAVRRNRLRRLFRECLREISSHQNSPEGRDYLVVVKKDIQEPTLNAIFSQWPKID